MFSVDTFAATVFLRLNRRQVEQRGGLPQSPPRVTPRLSSGCTKGLLAYAPSATHHTCLP